MNLIRLYGWALGVLVVASPALWANTGTFVDRQLPSDLRILTYNPLWNQIFPDESGINAAKFERILHGTQPDVINLQETTRSASAVANLLNQIAPLPGGTPWSAHQGNDNIIASRFPILDTSVNTVPAGERDLAIGRVDLPDDAYVRDFYIMNNHYACCDGGEAGRQRQSDAMVNWMRDAKSLGGSIDLPGHTAMAVLGDLNIVGGPQPLQTVITGNVIDERTYGADSPPDWDGSDLFDARPLHNVVGPEDYTWRDDSSVFNPGRLDYVIFSDSVLSMPHSYVLNTREMSPMELAATGLQADDVVLEPTRNRFDHLPLITDFRMASIEEIGDLSGNGQLDEDDLRELQQHVVAETDQLRFDMNGDRLVDANDVDFWITEIFGTLQGDANLDLAVDGSDFLAWNAAKFSSTDWFGGDFNSDGVADGSDLLIWNSHKFMSANRVANVPEPEFTMLLSLGLALLCARSWGK